MKKILLPTDFSNPANNAFVYDVNLARDLGASITLLHVFSLPLKSTITTFEEKRKRLIEEMVIAAKKEMTKLLERYPSDRVNRKEVRYGKFVDSEIADFARDEDFDLIIMGMKGEHEMLDKWMGSVTTNLMRKLLAQF